MYYCVGLFCSIDLQVWVVYGSSGDGTCAQWDKVNNEPGIVGIRYSKRNSIGYKLCSVSRANTLRHKSQIAIARTSNKNVRKSRSQIKRMSMTKTILSYNIINLTPIPFHKTELPWCLLGGNSCMQRLPLGD